MKETIEDICSDIELQYGPKNMDKNMADKIIAKALQELMK